MNEKGEWGPKRSYGYLNTWVPAVTQTSLCNKDGKLLLTGRESGNITFYITNYATKKQGRYHNTSAILAKDLAYHIDENPYVNELIESQRYLLFQAVNAINREQELAAPLVGWGDVYRSHHYVPIYWSSFSAALIRAFPSLIFPHANIEERPQECETRYDEVSGITGINIDV